MKNISGISIFTMLVTLVCFSAFSQKAYYFGPDAMVNVNDSVVIRLNNYQGDIQWQKSFDLDVWENIPGALHDTLLFLSDTTTYFRAEVIAGDCDPFYSDTTMVGVHKLNKDVRIINESEALLISDSTDLANGIYRFTGHVEDVQVGNVILGQQDDGFMRRVTAMLEKSNEYAFETEQANMEDVFDGLVLQDSIAITLNQNKTFMYDGRPLPLEVLYLPAGASLKNDGSGISFSNDTIYHDQFISFILESGTINFEPVIYREFDYQQIIDVADKLRSMRLTAGGMIDASMAIKVVSTEPISHEYSLLVGQFGVAVPVGPVPIDIVLSIYLGFEANMQLQMYATAGFESSYQVEFGAEYNRDAEPQWQAVWEVESNYHYNPPIFSVEGLVEAKAYFKPELALTIAGLPGPTFAVDPYLRIKGELDFPEWYWEIAAGIGGYLGFRVGLFGNYIFDYDDNLFTYDYILASGSSTIEGEIPLVETLPVTNITSTTAQSGGNVIDDGGVPVTSRGVVWSTSPNPTIENNVGYTTDGVGLGEFTSTLTGLTPETIYYVRAYANNGVGAGYGQQEDFITEDNGQPGEGVTDIDGNFYPSVIIGNQEWMAENLKTTKYRNGTPIVYPGTDATSWDNNTTGAYAWFDNDIAWKNSYGALYNWYAVNNSNGLCPTGWHVPSDAEWTELVDYLVAQDYPNEPENPNGAGNALKSCRQVNSPLGGDCTTSEHPRWDWINNLYGSDEFGFSALPGGNRRTYGSYFNLGHYGDWWSSNENSATHAWARYLYSGSGEVGRYFIPKFYGYSVRCLRDSDNPTFILNLNVSPSAGGIVTGAGEYTEGTTVTIAATPNTNYHFVNWTGDTDHIADANASSTTLTMPTQNITLTANFEENGGGNGEPGEGVTDIDGNFYPSVIIGNQEWMAKNLKTTKYRNGTPIVYPGTDNTSWENNTAGAYAWYDNDIAWKDSYGALYNWHAVDNSNGLCPTGWHVPSDAEWTELVDYLVSQGFPNEWHDPNGAGNALKSCHQVSSPLGGDCATSQHPRWDLHSTHYGTDEFGFSALPGAIRNANGAYHGLGDVGLWWSSSETSSASAWRRTLSHLSGSVYPSYWYKELGSSVRCVRDSDGPTYTLNLNVSPSAGGTVTGAGQYPEGTTVTITATPNTNYQFLNWTGDTEFIADANASSTTVTMPAQNITLTANFDENGGTIQPGAGVTDIDGNFYPSVIIGNQEWMAENLKTTKYRNGTMIEYPGTDNTAWQDNTTGAYAWYSNDITWKDSYGALYNWHAVNNSNGLCPTGWHVPSHDEWTQLEQYICNQLGNVNCETQFPYDNSTTGWRGTNEGNALKSCRQVSSPFGGDCATSEHPRWNSHSTHYGTDEFGFSALSGGYRYAGGLYSLLGSYGRWWSSTEYSPTDAWGRFLGNDFGNVYRIYISKDIGFSVRCVRDID